jgi:2-polyprenyl-6-hydroxyphenyl methylase/3-demethylubiquinone-9 3-methyltransferase
MTVHNAPEYAYKSAAHTAAHDILVPCLDALLGEIKPHRIFDLGCGNGSVANHLSKKFDVAGIDLSESGIAEANAAFPRLRLERASVYDDLAGKYGQFDAVVSLEVVEHLIDPRLYARRMFDLVRPGGHCIVSTPYHGYLKNVAMAVTGKMDNHFTALWDGGHIKFWSVRTLTILLEEAGFRDVRFRFVGRVRWLAKSMVAVARRPTA